MGAMRETLLQFLPKLHGSVAPVGAAAEKLLGAGSDSIEENGAFLISRRPKIGPEAYACVLHQGLTDDMVGQYLQSYTARSGRNFVLAESYRKVLTVLNGGWVYKLCLYGIPPSMCSDPPFLNRSTRQPLDIGEADRSWSVDYKPAPGQLHFGSSPFSWEENLGYFLKADGSVDALRKGGSIFRSWGTMRDCLTDEIRRNEEAFPQHEERWFSLNQERERKEAERRAKRRTRKSV
jgi:hypothetical protein